MVDRANSNNDITFIQNALVARTHGMVALKTGMLSIISQVFQEVRKYTNLKTQK